MILSRDASSCLLSARWENHEQSGFTDLKNKPVILFNPFFSAFTLISVYLCVNKNETANEITHKVAVIQQKSAGSARKAAAHTDKSVSFDLAF